MRKTKQTANPAPGPDLIVDGDVPLRLALDPCWVETQAQIADLKREVAHQTNFAESYSEDRSRLVDALVREAKHHMLRFAELKDFLDSFGVSLD